MPRRLRSRCDSRIQRSGEQKSRPPHFVRPVTGTRAAGHRQPATHITNKPDSNRTPPPEHRKESRNGDQVGAAFGQNHVQIQKRPTERFQFGEPRHGTSTARPSDPARCDQTTHGLHRRTERPKRSRYQLTQRLTTTPTCTTLLQVHAKPGEDRNTYLRHNPSAPRTPDSTPPWPHAMAGVRTARPTENSVHRQQKKDTTTSFPRLCRLWGLLRHLDLTPSYPPVRNATPQGRQPAFRGCRQCGSEEPTDVALRLGARYTTSVLPDPVAGSNSGDHRPMAQDTITPTIQEADLDHFVAHFTQVNDHISLAIGLMFWCGLRVSETTKLSWSDLVRDNLPLNAIALSGEMCKNHHARTVPIPGKLCEHLINVWESHARPHNISISHYATARSKNCRATSTRTIQRHVRDIGQALGYPKLTPHVLRHTFATRLLAVSNLITVQQALGHRRVTTTQRYAHPTSEEMRTAMEKMS